MGPTDTPQPKLRLWVPIVGGTLVILLIGGIVMLPKLISLIPLPSLPSGGEQETAPSLAKLPETFNKTLWSYGPPGEEKPAVPSPQPPVAAYTQRYAPVPAKDEAKERREAQQQSEHAALAATLQSLIPFLDRFTQQQETKPPAQQATQGPQATPAQKPLRSEQRHWEYLVRGKKEEKAAGPEEQKKLPPGAAEAQNLIQPARWSRPASPTKTLYRSMVLKGALLDAVNSDIPSPNIRIRLTEPLRDKFGVGTTILDQESIVIVSQQGRPEWGQRRLPLKIEQIEPPDGSIIAMEGMVGGPDRAAGLPTAIDNHYGKLALSVLINAVLSLGSSALSGTPSGYYPSPGQQASREIVQSTSNDIRSISQQQLKVPPTLTAKEGEVVTIAVLKNIQFNRLPQVVR